jgi:hypothetical protein
MGVISSTTFDLPSVQIQDGLAELVNDQRTRCNFRKEMKDISASEYRRWMRILNDLNRLGALLPELLTVGE